MAAGRQGRTAASMRGRATFASDRAPSARERGPLNPNPQTTQPGGRRRDGRARPRLSERAGDGPSAPDVRGARSGDGGDGRHDGRPHRRVRAAPPRLGVGRCRGGCRAAKSTGCYAARDPIGSGPATPAGLDTPAPRRPASRGSSSLADDRPFGPVERRALRLVTGRTQEPQVAELVRAAKRTGDDVVDRQRHAEGAASPAPRPLSALERAPDTSALPPGESRRSLRHAATLAPLRLPSRPWRLCFSRARHTCMRSHLSASATSAVVQPS